MLFIDMYPLIVPIAFAGYDGFCVISCHAIS